MKLAVNLLTTKQCMEAKIIPITYESKALKIGMKSKVHFFQIFTANETIPTHVVPGKKLISRDNENSRFSTKL